MSHAWELVLSEDRSFVSPISRGRESSWCDRYALAEPTKNIKMTNAKRRKRVRRVFRKEKTRNIREGGYIPLEGERWQRGHRWKLNEEKERVPDSLGKFDELMNR